MLKNELLGKHSHNNRDSREGQVLRYVREARKLSLKDVAAKLNLKSLDIDHFENGRKFYSPEDVSKFLVCYNFSADNFKDIMGLKVLNKLLVNHFLMKP
ncbi:MAG: helix-turn-helix transcriptional regulator [Bacteriovorax sp.]|nr:helix-turn-helix transcriptional regulator [Bacteriovorax sp.]